MAQNQQMQRQQQRPPTALELLDRYKGEFQRVIPKHIGSDRLVRVAMSALSNNKALMACDGYSVLRAVMQSATLGLEIGVLGEAYMIPYGSTATFIPGYQGLIKLALQSGAVQRIQVGAHYEDDLLWDYGLGSEPFVKHKPALKDHEEFKELLAAYTVCRLSSGGDQVTVMGKEQIEKIRARSRAKSNGPWVTDYEQMAIKTTVRRAMKNVPKTPQLIRALEAEDRAEMGQPLDGLFPEVDEVSLPGEEEHRQPAQPRDTASAAAAALGVSGGTATDVAGLDAEAAAAEKAQGQRRREPGEDG